MASRRSVLAWLIGAGAWAGVVGGGRVTLHGRQRPLRSYEVFRGGAELVPTTVTVRDASGRLVTTLDQDDFSVAESGRVQPITQFARDRVPVSLALVLDISDSMRGPRMDDARAALAVFIDELLAEEDEAALIVFNHESKVLAGWALDRAPLGAALTEVRPTGGTAIYDAILQALPMFADRRHPRGAILLVSDGADTASSTSVVDLKQQLARSDVLLYGIAVDTPNARSAARINPQVFHELSAQSGGYAEIVSSTAEIAPAAARIAEELNNQYMLGYTPTTPGDGRYRSIRVTVGTGDAYLVRSRRGVVR